MMAMAHTLVAGTIAKSVADPIFAPALALASHFILDAIPHWDFGTNWRKRTKLSTGVFAILDTTIALAVGWKIFSPYAEPSVLLLCLILSLLPDWMEAPWYIFFADPTRIGPKKNASWMERLTYGVYAITNKAHTKAPFPWGLFSQIAVVTFFLLLVQ